MAFSFHYQPEFDTFEKALEALANKEVNGVLIEKNSAINVKSLVESNGLRISRSFQCSLRIGIAAEPQWDPKNNKTVVKSIQKMRQMHELCLKEKCRKKLYGEAVNAAQKQQQVFISKLFCACVVFIASEMKIPTESSQQKVPLNFFL